MEGDPADTSYPLVVREPVTPACERCASRLLQLEAWHEHTGGGLTLRMRCPECDERTVREVGAEDAARVDDALSRARLEMVDLYEAVVRSNLAHESDLLAQAFALDLIGPEDFAPRG